MKKLYYTDPIAAAYMAREFGVVIWDGEELTRPTDFMVHSIQGCSPFAYYIHPDSLHIFEPQEGDLVERTSHGCTVFGWYVKEFGCKQIIQRNNKPFFWPESGS